MADFRNLLGAVMPERGNVILSARTVLSATVMMGDLVEEEGKKQRRASYSEDEVDLSAKFGGLALNCPRDDVHSKGQGSLSCTARIHVRTKGNLDYVSFAVVK